MQHLVYMTQQNNYVICIPSYKRATFCNDKTLATLHKNKIDPNLVFVYVANKTEYDIYFEILNPKLFNKIIIGEEGLHNICKRGRTSEAILNYIIKR